MTRKRLKQQYPNARFTNDTRANLQKRTYSIADRDNIILIEPLVVPGNPFHLFDADNITGLDNDEAVGLWTNEGTSNDLFPPGVGAPLYKTSGGPEGGAYVDFADGDFLDSTASYTEISQPLVVATAFHLDEVPIGEVQYIVDGNNTNANPWIRVDFGPSLRFDAGSTIITGASLSTDTWYWIVVEYDGASSRYEVSTGDTGTGDAGTQGSDYLRVGLDAAQDAASDLDGGISFIGFWNDGTTFEAVKAYMLGKYPSL